MEPDVLYTTTEDGANIAYTTLGSGPSVIMTSNLHSFSGRLRLHPGFQAVCQAIARRFTLVLYDGRGMGLSAREYRDYGIDARVKDLESVIRVVGAETFALYGILYGGFAAIVYAARHPERMTSLVLENSVASGERWFRDSPIGRVNVALAAVTTEQWEYVSEAIAARVIPRDAPQEASRIVGTLLRESFTPADFLLHRQALREIDFSRKLAAVSSPTLVISTDTVGQPFEHARELASAIPSARLIRVASGWEGWSDRDYVKLMDFLAAHVLSSAGDAEPPITPSGMTAILFADIADSTALTERLGDAAFRAKARDLGGALRALIRECAGQPVEGPTLGDGVMAVFTSARAAIAAALACASAGASAGLPLHIGLHAGDVTREKDPDGRSNVYGGAVNIASRIAGLSAAGEVLVSETVRSLARTSGGVSFEDRGRRRLKGVGETVRVWAVREGE
jgi:class 3 adenylate cyclase/pimeloyl-ACP methyl ester carboxylesterase